MECPKCGNEMKRKMDLVGHLSVAIRVRKSEDWFGDKVIPIECQNCGYIELYNEKNLA
jgi:predicted nucleic-acid-binding Zn-ribbon protein